MSTITKEQVIQIEAAAKEVLWPIVWTEKKARTHFSQKVTPEVVLELARITRAYMDIKPPMSVEEEQKSSAAYMAGEGRPNDTIPSNALPQGMQIDIEMLASALKNAPLAPSDNQGRPRVPVVPPAIEPDYKVIKSILPTANPDEYACCIAADMWNACRAAMLQGVEQPQNARQNIPENIPDGNSPAIPDDWVMVPKEPTQAMIKAWLSEVANFRGHAAGYKAALAAAPQREVK
ncbi:hypothetical protein ACV2HE_18965 [Salmonella enterica subsp. enterica serovar Carrau]